MTNDETTRATGRESMRVGAAVLMAALVGLVGCETREIAQPENRKQASEGGQLVFSDDFQRQEIGSDWRRGQGEGGAGKWQIEQGWLTASNIKNDPLWLDRPLPEKVRVEFDAKAASSEGDLKAEIFGDGTHHATGYILIFGGWDNQLDVVARLDEHGEDRKQQKSRSVQKGKTYRWAIERTDGTLRWYIDGELFMTYDDPKPLTGEGHRHFAFNDWTAPVRFDNVKVYDLTGSSE